MKNSAARAMCASLCKDARVSAEAMPWGVALALAFGITATVDSEAGFWMMSATGASLMMIAPFVEWKTGTGGLVASLPVSRRTAVTARYVASVTIISSPSP